MTVHRFFSGITLIGLGALALLQVMGIAYFGLTWWPAVLVWLGLEITWGSLFSRWHGPSLFGAALGLFVGGLGLVRILENLGLTAGISASEMVSIGWPVLIVALGLSLLFNRKRRWNVRWER